MTVKIRIEALPDDVNAALMWLRSVGARLTGITHLYPNGNNEEARVYAVMTPPPAIGNSETVERAALAQQARARALELQTTGDAIRAAYYSGLADGLET